MPHIGPALKRVRLLRGMKQSHVAELAGVTQATVSRWEHGTHQPDPAQAARLLDLLEARLDGASDRALRRLVETSAVPVHLVCDVSHRLLAASPGRAGEWGRSAAEMLGHGMYVFATDQIREAEGQLPDLGWFEPLGPPVITWTAANDSPIIRIKPGYLLWERLRLSDGSVARLCTTLRTLDQLQAQAPDAVTLRTAP